MRAVPRAAARRRRRAVHGARRSVRAGDDLALTTAPLWRDTPLAGDREAFAARFWARRDAAAHGLRVPGAAAVALRAEGRAHVHDLSRHARGRAARTAARGPAGRGGGRHVHAAATRRSPTARRPRATRTTTPAGEGARCVGCHMPRVVYGVLDVHRSHRIEVPDPARAAAAGRPDACTGCHVGETPAWAADDARAAVGRDGARASPETRRAARGRSFAGDPVTRAVSADALGREQVPLPPRGARGARGRAARSHGQRRLSGRAPPRVARARAARRRRAPTTIRRRTRARAAPPSSALRARLGDGGTTPAPEVVRRACARAPSGEDVEIGE